jgi:hypothetical protein
MAKAPKQAAPPRHPMDPILRAKIDELRGTSSQPTREQWERDQGFIQGLEWALLMLENTRYQKGSDGTKTRQHEDRPGRAAGKIRVGRHRR